MPNLQFFLFSPPYSNFIILIIAFVKSRQNDLKNRKNDLFYQKLLYSYGRIYVIIRYRLLLGGFIMLNILVCDDDIDIVNQISALLKEFSNQTGLDFSVDLKSSAKDVLKNFVNYDIAFIDIEMPEVNGLTLAEKLNRINEDMIVIVITSYQKYLDDAMKIHVFRYLSKPIDPDRFNRNLKEAVLSYQKASKTIVINAKPEIYFLKTKDILYIENQKYGSIIYTKGNDFKTSKKPKELLADINQPDRFVFSHTSIIVNLQNVVDFSKNSVTLRKNETETITTYISQRKYSSFKKAFIEFAGGIK